MTAADPRAALLRHPRWDRAYAETEEELTQFFAPRLTALSKVSRKLRTMER
jgi:hypothetical protein